MQITLTPQQQQVVTDIVAFARQRSGDQMVLIGQGGSGKTTCVQEAARGIIAHGGRVLMTAPTNKAVKVLRLMARVAGLTLDRLEFMTIHKALGLALLPSEERKTAKQVGISILAEFDLVVIDECSMLGRRVCYEYLFPEANTKGARLLYMGDDFQTLPVRERLSPVFTEIPKIIRLEQSMRQAEGSLLLSVNGLLRTAMQEARPFRFNAEEWPDANGITLVKDADFMQRIVAHFAHDNVDLDRHRVLAWTNRRVNRINQRIRETRHGRDVPPFLVGERVVTAAPVMAEREVLLGTDEECRIHHVDAHQVVEVASLGVEYRAIQLVLHPLFDESVAQVVVNVIHPDSESDFREALAAIAAHAKRSGDIRQWAHYFAIKETFADIRHCACITVHRSQGSTYDVVFVDIKDILTNTKREERQRLLYVATSRPRHGLVINKARYTA